ncbi:MAG: hypothetical protein GTN62_14210 [Gemmatimonadales bacterium]|nr:hypothetical protein [Gemmatimonadales bacterium]NIN13225.1 hypothetical protein [Gemmatimonadales bacterium]NIN51242.1 hypothetical protein [Gemmatimonadales bacterium]NIP08706.1 hypothetical protein [Gemmatimonadales bacterium]NIR00959.1 hypothetical protein [Gemmatimonadales bacterium]
MKALSRDDIYTALRLVVTMPVLLLLAIVATNVADDLLTAAAQHVLHLDADLHAWLAGSASTR